MVFSCDIWLFYKEYRRRKTSSSCNNAYKLFITIFEKNMKILILRKKIKLIQLLQLLVAIFFGYFTDFALWLIQDISFSFYYEQWILSIIGILLVSIGVWLEVKADIVVLAVEGLVMAICKVLPIKFGNMKMILDTSFVIIAIVLSFVFMDGLYGIGAGTVAAAIFVGLIVKWINKLSKVVIPKLSYYFYRSQTYQE